MAQPLPELAPLLAAARSGPALDLSAPVAGLRAAADAGVVAASALVRSRGELHAVEELEVAGVPVRLYRPTAEQPTAVHVHLHGGGWWMGSLDTTDALARSVAAGSGITVVSVGYRLAPEHPFPAGLEDVCAVLRWAAEALRPSTLSVGGESAGANLAAAACLVARDRGGPEVVAQWLDVPALDLTLPDSPSLRDYGTGFGLDVAQLQVLLDWYSTEEQRRDPGASPLLAGDLTGLPPAIITTAELDPLRDQGQAYAEALTAAGVPVAHSTWAGHLHGTMWLTGLTESGRECHDSSVAQLVALHRASGQVAA